MLIGVLAAILIAVLIKNSQLPNQSGETHAVEQATSNEQSPQGSTLTLTATRTPPEFPEIDLDAIVRQSPFRSPVLAPPEDPPATVSASTTVSPVTDVDADSIQSRLKVSAVMERGGRRIALIGNQVVSEGDSLGDGLQVLAIRPDGIVVGRQSAAPRGGTRE